MRKSFETRLNKLMYIADPMPVFYVIKESDPYPDIPEGTPRLIIRVPDAAYDRNSALRLGSVPNDDKSTS